MGVESRLGAMNTIVEKNITLLQRKLATDRSIFFSYGSINRRRAYRPPIAHSSDIARMWRGFHENLDLVGSYHDIITADL